MDSGTDEVLILVNVAPLDPYPGLFRTGPEQTWFGELVPGTRVLKIEGLAPRGIRRQLADLRLMMSFPLSLPSTIGTTNSRSFLMRGYARLVLMARNPRAERSHWATVIARFTRSALIVSSRFTLMWGRRFSSLRKNVFRSSVETRGETIRVRRVQTINNSMALRLDVLYALAQGRSYRGVAFVTASAYVDRRRLLNWVEHQATTNVVGGSNALVHENDASDFLSGFFTYFSWDLVKKMAQSRDFDHSLADDAATTKWLQARGIGWADPGIQWETTPLDEGLCPLCEDEALSIVRCTSHGARYKEAEYMRQLHHQHDPEEGA